MLTNKETNKINKVIKELDISEIVDMARRMGIEIKSSDRGYHRIKNSDGEYEILDLNNLEQWFEK